VMSQKLLQYINWIAAPCN